MKHVLIFAFSLFMAKVAVCSEEMSAPTAKFKEPFLVSAKGAVKITDGNGKLKPARIGQLLREKINLETGEGGLALIALSKTERLVIGPQTSISLPVISWEDGSVERIELEKGQIRLQNLTSNPRLVVTPISRDPYSEVDVLFDYNPQTLALKAFVIEGRTLFRGLENEDFLNLEKNEQSTFTGLRQNGEIAFDILLQGRKVARGKMSEKSKVQGNLKAWWNEMDRLEKNYQNELAKQKILEKKSGTICDKPKAKFNECAWICEANPKGEKKICRLEAGAKCIRKRCDANGLWGDALVLPASKSPCLAEPKVAPCDY